MGELDFTKTVTVTTSATPDYSIGDCIGGILTIEDVSIVPGRPVELKSVCVRDKAGQAPQLTIYFFKATPAGGTYDDNAALNLDAGDPANLVGVVQLTTSNYRTVDGVSMAALGNIGQLLAVAAGSLFALIAADAAYNAAGTSDLLIELGLERKYE